MHRNTVFQLIAAFVGVQLLYLTFVYSSGSKQHVVLLDEKASSDIAATMQRFLKEIAHLHPSKGFGNIPRLEKWNRNMGDDMHAIQDKGIDTPITFGMYKEYLQVEDGWRDTLREQHRQVVDRIPPVPTSLSGRGVVMTGGGQLFGVALVAISYYLEHHPGLPIELWMARDEYEPHWCKDIFPALNVTCKIIEDTFGAELQGFDYIGFPLKALALLGSQFEEVYFTDIDSFPLYSINDLFTCEPYRQHGYISWPDYWIRVTTPDFYDVAGVLNVKDMNPDQELLTYPGVCSARLSTESGQMVFNKTKHWDTMCLAMYYNLNGMDHYFPLLQQNWFVDGFGDKETFMSAAAVLGHPGYQVEDGIITFGYGEPSGNFRGSAMAQCDPFSDWMRHHKGKEKEISKKPYIFHANSMKLNPYEIFSNEPPPRYNSPNMHLNPVRNLGDLDSVVEKLGYDMEYRLFTHMEKVICDWLIKDPPESAADKEVDLVETCRRAQQHLVWLKEHPKNVWPEGEVSGEPDPNKMNF